MEKQNGAPGGHCKVLFQKTVSGLSRGTDPTDGHADLHSMCWYIRAISTRGYEGEGAPWSARVREVGHTVSCSLKVDKPSDTNVQGESREQSHGPIQPIR